MTFQKNPTGQYTALTLVRTFFVVANKELIALNKEHRNDVVQLASAIARQFNLEPLAFEPVAY